ncbi:lipoyl(octanoyl) transferase LipB [Enterobacteriaceae endosymbiont of Plateumaris consimilis]|uniref:lipoyl(octanoyl) transferase LipB n=1 Tax=Enterobacteriaceae endosymbiont of Plateumaris consimilis TaxID=2675794 RepID=UPI0014493DDE|nr:lipoyl(octanoyl) transferase LipB [Enterobacteriaceae endosymbiont of Plateumaris consimilis]QJC28490.1 lipoyl(octanoyl) transferase LipB [Enterobacteriaceae endosymbiont of Plateumaris consimilis]
MYNYENNLFIRHLGIEPWILTYEKMNNFTDQRNISTLDEIWMVEHTPVFTQGRTSEKKDILYINNKIPLFNSNRGGKITYHAPGQQLMYVLINLKKRNISIRILVSILEQTVINVLFYIGIKANRLLSNYNPGVYINNKKIASIGLKISKGCSLHGIAINVDMDLLPFSYINPCGLHQLKMTQIRDLVPNIKISIVKNLIINEFIKLLNKYSKI